MSGKSADSPPKATSELIKSITQSADRLQHSTTSVSERIEQFEKWLAGLPGRVEAELHAELADPGENCPEPYYFSMRLCRFKGDWKLLCGFSLASENPKWAPLVEADVDTKLLALSNLGALLEKLHEEQANRLKKIEEANSSFDEFALALGINQQKEEASDDIPF
jgi:hypothetical protein